jgi:alpha-tubulin suppressor-like RCC1 family protein
VVLALFDGGCALVASLGDPKELAVSLPGGADAADISDGDAASGAVVQAVAIAVGETHACAVVRSGPSSPDNGTIRCWGSNASGELGSDPAQVARSWRPFEVAGRGAASQSKAASLTLAAGYSCTITTDQYLLCWGDVPSGSRVSRAQAVPAYEPSQMNFDVSPLQASQASMGPEGGCCTQFDQSLVCWGGDLAAQQPDAGVHLDGGVFVGDAFDSVAVGAGHACGIGSPSSINTRDVECWGRNDSGQAGMPPSSVVDHPHRLGLGTMGTLVQVAAGGNVSCALFQSGALYCWGANDRGQLGPGASAAQSAVPVRVPLATGAIAVALGDAHACAVLGDRSVWCWGDDSSAQLGGGPGGPSLSAAPVRVLKGPSGRSLSGVQSIAAGGGTTCALVFGDPNVWCWGDNGDGQAGQSPAASPVLEVATSVAW